MCTILTQTVHATFHNTRYEVITTPTDIIMVIEYAGGELFNYIVEKGKVGMTESGENGKTSDGGSAASLDARIRSSPVLPANHLRYGVLSSARDSASRLKTGKVCTFRCRGVQDADELCFLDHLVSCWMIT